ncbi:MAG: 2-dehydropantoate 2-reductase [Sandaracinaceae bacterium]|nr:MAG: 2-dehydropantoate 2-reductase [Sandaracinaceae bacterium]
MRVGIYGAGSIGCFVGARLLSAGADVTFVGRARLKAEIATHGLTASDFERRDRHAPEAVRYETDVTALAACQAVLVCVKSAQTEAAARALDAVLTPDCLILSLQNGVRNATTLRAHLGSRTVVPTIVDFNVVSRGEGVFHRGFSGPLVLSREPRAEALFALLARALETKVVDDIAPAQWTKLLVNLNNAVSALTDAPTQRMLQERELRLVVAAIIDEAVGVLRADGVRPPSLRGVPVWLMPKILRLPTPIVRLVTRAQVKVDAEARSSMWEDLRRGRETEVEYLNGEIVRVAERVGLDAPINRRIVALVHAAEEAGEGSPGLSGAELAEALGVRR